MDFVDFVKTILKYKVWGLVVFLILILIYLFRILLDEDKSNVWRGRIYKILYKLTKRREAEKKYIASDVAGRLNLARRNLPFGKDLIPKSLKVEWVESSAGEAYVPKEGELVVKLDPAEQQERNIISLAQVLIQRTALIGVRHVLNKPLEDSIDLNLVKNLLNEIGNRTILDWFMKYDYMPRVEQNKDLKNWNSKIVEIDERGLFTRLLLVELDNYGKKIAGRPKTLEMELEITGLIEFLYKIATKNYGENAPLDYMTRNMKIGILIVGETSKILTSITPYLKAFAWKLEEEVDSIYVISFAKELLKEKDEDSENVFKEMESYLHKKIETNFKVKKDFELSYFCYDVNGRKRKSKCVRYIPIYCLFQSKSPPVPVKVPTLSDTLASAW